MYVTQSVGDNIKKEDTPACSEKEEEEEEEEMGSVIF